MSERVPSLPHACPARRHPRSLRYAHAPSTPPLAPNCTTCRSSTRLNLPQNGSTVGPKHPGSAPASPKHLPQGCPWCTVHNANIRHSALRPAKAARLVPQAYLIAFASLSGNENGGKPCQGHFLRTLPPTPTHVPLDCLSSAPLCFPRLQAVPLVAWASCSRVKACNQWIASRSALSVQLGEPWR